MTVNRIKKHCAEFAQICVTEHKVEIQYRDTTVYVTDTIEITLPRDTVQIIDTVKIVNNLAYLPTIHKEFGMIGVDAGVDRSILSVNAYLLDSTLLVTEIDTVFLPGVVTEKIITDTVTVRYIPRAVKYLLYGIILAVVLLVVRFALKKFI